MIGPLNGALMATFLLLLNYISGESHDCVAFYRSDSGPRSREHVSQRDTMNWPRVWVTLRASNYLFRLFSSLVFSATRLFPPGLSTASTCGKCLQFSYFFLTPWRIRGRKVPTKFRFHLFLCLFHANWTLSCRSLYRRVINFEIRYCATIAGRILNVRTTQCT